MLTNREIAYYAMYVIGEVESNWNWTAVYYADPITIGMMQWYGTRAAGLLNRIKNEMPEAYAQLAPTLRASLDAHNAEDNYWTSRYLTETEGNSIVSVFSSKENHVIQENQAIADFEGYITLLEGWGLTVSDPKSLIFAMAMYHQSPKAAGRVVQTAGGNATLERIYQVCLNDGTLGRYRNRYNTVYARLQAWDGQSPPPDFGQTGSASTGGDAGGISQDSSQLGYIIQVGDNLVLYGSQTFKNGVIFYKSTGQTWIPSRNANGTPITGGNTGGGSGGASAVVALYTSWVGRFAYSQAPGRLTPLTSGYGDCSSTIWAAYHDAAGIDVGTWTGAMEGKGTLIAEGTNSTLPIDRLQPGDLIIVWRGSGTSQHVEMYIGDNKLCGHGGPGNGPTIKENASSYTTTRGYWQARRYI